MNVGKLVLSGAALLAPMSDVTLAADAATPVATAASCAASDIKPPDDASDEIKAVYAQIAQKCAQLKLLGVSAQLSGAKLQDIAAALAGFSSIEGNAGTNTNADKVGHLAEWVAKQVLHNTAAGVGVELNELLKSEAYVVVTDDAAVAHRSRYIEATRRMNQLSTALVAASRDANQVLTKAPTAAADPTGARIGLAPLLALIPPAITAAQGLSSLAKQSNTFGGISVTADASTMLSGFGRCLSSEAAANLIEPRFASGTNPFVSAYDQLQIVRAAAQEMSGRLDTAASSAANAKATERQKELAQAKEGVDAAILATSTFEKFLAEPSDDPKETRLASLISAGAILGRQNTGLLVIKATQFGASYSNATHTFKSDTLGIQASAQVAYLLFTPAGTLRKSGVVSQVKAMGFAVGSAQSELQAFGSASPCGKQTPEQGR